MLIPNSSNKGGSFSKSSGLYEDAMSLFDPDYAMEGLKMEGLDPTDMGPDMDPDIISTDSVRFGTWS